MGASHCFLEYLGRPIFSPDRFLDDLDFIGVWHGLQAVLLSGHTHGHMGFYCASLQLMFSADLFASYGWSVRYPPPVFISAPKQIPASADRALGFVAHVRREAFTPFRAITFTANVGILASGFYLWHDDPHSTVA